MYSTHQSSRIVGLAATTAMTAALLSGCAMNTAPRADVAAASAQHELAAGRSQSAIRHAEDAVRADPRNASYRAVLASAYLDAGRFASAETAFHDAMTLGDTSPRTGLSLALAMTAQGKYQQAATLLNQYKGKIATADLGLALGLADHPEQGIKLMENAIRSGQNTVKMRQNLAYTYALAGRWREARLMAEQDVPANMVSDRISKWAELNSASAYQMRVASLLGVPAGVHDAGEPVELALANSGGATQLAAADSTPVPAAAASPAAQAPAPAAPQVAQAPAAPAASPPAATSGMAVAATASELPSVGKPAPAKQHVFAQAFAPPAPADQAVQQDSVRFVSNPVVQALPVSQRAAHFADASQEQEHQASPLDSSPLAANGSHLVQLGSFSSEKNARRAWAIYLARYPELSNHKMVISRAVVRGKHYWRVSAAGYDRMASKAMCRRVDEAHGDGCITWAAADPLPGAIDSGVRMALR